MRTFLALFQTMLAAFQWKLVMTYAAMERDYSPEVLASVHFHQPLGLKVVAISITVSAAFCWYMAWLKADRS
jgi:hypothetical protein